MSSKSRLIVPVKNLEESKTSFSDVLSSGQRQDLTLSMLGDVLRVAKRIEKIDTAVVTPDEKVKNFVKDQSVEVISEPGVGLIRALEIALGDSVDSSYEEVLILPGDVPLLKGEDIEDILDLAVGERCVVITPSKENGTNALLLRPPNVIDLHYGGESFPEHVKEAREREVNLRIYRSDNLERDIDDPSDLIKVETLGKGTRTHSFINTLK